MRKVKPPINENYENDYGTTDYKDKTVLDIGADYGSTAYFFLQKGAKKVIAVEGDADLCIKLLENVSADHRVSPVLVWIDSYKSMSRLIRIFKPDITKADCEGCEIYFKYVPDDVLRICPEYMVETHGDTTWFDLRDKFSKAGFKLKSIREWTRQVRLCHWVK